MSARPARPYRLLAFALILCSSLAHAAPLLHADHPLVGKLWDMRSKSFIDQATLLARIAPVDILLLGETHDNPAHHEAQQRLLRARTEAGARPALLMEQFNSERQTELNAALAGSDQTPALASAATLSKGWDWAAYRPLLATAFDLKLPVLAANLSRERALPVIRQGFSAFDAAELKRLFVEAVWNAPREKYLTELIEESHCKQISSELRDGLVRGQRLRDAVMADTALAEIKRGVIGIIGRGHARRDIGLPLYLAARMPDARIYAIGFVEVSPEKTAAGDYETERVGDEPPYDVIWFSARHERPDPCLAFGKTK